MVIGDLGSTSLFRNRAVMRTVDENAKHLQSLWMDPYSECLGVLGLGLV